MSEEGPSFLNKKQRDYLNLLDKARLASVLSKFCAKNCGVFKQTNEDLPHDCLKNCADNVDRTYEKFTASIKASLVQGGEGTEE